MLSRLPRSAIQALQRVLNAAARVTMNLSLCDHVKPALKQLHWLPVEQKITYKLCLFMHHIHTGQAPQYLSRLCIHSFCTQCMQIAAEVDWLSGLRSAKKITRFGERGFSYRGPAAWNTLPSDLQDITDTGTFRKRLQSVLYNRAYTTDYCWRSWTCRIAAPYKFHVD